jgi:hypothetical protein
MDGTDQIEADDTDLLSDAAVVRLRAHPRFHEAVHAFAASALDEYEAQDPATRWLNRDLGRSALCLAILILDGTPDGLNLSVLAQMAVQRNVCSRGRALAFVHYALATGRLTLAEGPGPWARRRLTPTAALLAPVRVRATSSLGATAIIAPEVAEALPRLTSDAVVRQTAAAVGALLTMRPELDRNPGGPLRQIFIARDAGMRVLQHLIVRQAPNRRRLLEAAPVSRAELSRRYNVSRTHVNRLLSEAEAAGALSFAAPNQIVFNTAFSDEVESYFAGMMQVNRVVAQMMLAMPA